MHTHHTDLIVWQEVRQTSEGGYRCLSQNENKQAKSMVEYWSHSHHIDRTESPN